MKKCLAILLALCVAASGSIVYGQQKISESGRQISFAEQTLAGDKAATQGLHVVSHIVGPRLDAGLVTVSRRADWTVDTSISDRNKTRAEYQVSREGENAEGASQGASLCVTIGRDADVDGPSDFCETFIPKGMEVVYQQMADETKAGESCTKTFRLKDYMDEWPLKIVPDVEENLLLANREAEEDLLSYFRIPLNGEEQMKIRIEKDDRGEVCSLRISTDGSGEIEYTYETLAVENGCYLAEIAQTVHADGAGGETIRGGLYFIPFDTVRRDDGSLYLKNRRAQELYAARSREEVISLTENSDKTEVQLITADGDGYLFRAFAKNGGKLLCELRLPKERVNVGEEGYCQIVTGKDLWVIVAEDETNENQNENASAAVRTSEDQGKSLFASDQAGENQKGSPFAAVRRREDGVYETVLSGEMDRVFLQRTFLDDAAMALYQDGKLAVCANCTSAAATDEEDAIESCGFLLAVYDETGQLYEGEYACSLDIGTPNATIPVCRPAQEDPYALYWE